MLHIINKNSNIVVNMQQNESKEGCSLAEISKDF